MIYNTQLSLENLPGGKNLRTTVRFVSVLCTSVALERLYLGKFQNEYSDLRAFIPQNQGRIALRNVPSQDTLITIIIIIVNLQTKFNDL